MFKNQNYCVLKVLRSQVYNVNIEFAKEKSNQFQEIVRGQKFTWLIRLILRGLHNEYEHFFNLLSGRFQW